MAQLGKSVKGKEKKQKGGKGSGQTAEERAVEERARRLKENEIRKKLAEEAKARMCRKVEEERKLTEVNKVKITNQWRRIMRLVKVERLRKELEIFSQVHERDVDRKDAVIQMLDRNLEEAEDQYQVALRKHLQHIDNLIDLQQSRVLGLENEFHRELNTVSTEFNSEKERIMKQHTKEVNELKSIMAAVEAEEREKAAETKQEHEQTREEIRSKNLEEIHVLKMTLESTIEELERQFESAHLAYLQNTDQRTQDFKYLTRKDQELSREIEIKIKKIEKLQAALSDRRAKISTNAKECEQRNGSLREEKEQISKHFQNLKARMNKFRSEQERKLVALTKRVKETKDVLQDQCNLADSIFTLANLARKLETEQERKSTEYSLSGSSRSAMKGVESKTNEDWDNQIEEGKEMDDVAYESKYPEKHPKAIQDGLASSTQAWRMLENFYKRFNKSMLDKLAIEREKNRLEAENNKLRQLLKNCDDGTSIKSEVMDTPNPLMVINGRGC